MSVRSSSVANDAAAMLNANHFVMGFSSFAASLALLSNQTATIYASMLACDIFMLCCQNSKVTHRRDGPTWGVHSYRLPGEEMARTRKEQTRWMLTFPVSQIV